MNGGWRRLPTMLRHRGISTGHIHLRGRATISRRHFRLARSPYSITMTDTSNNYISYCAVTPSTKMTYTNPTQWIGAFLGERSWCFDQGSAY